MELKLRDLRSPSGVLTLSRIVLALAFPFTLRVPLLALAVLVIGGLTDLIDGFLARRFGWTSETGATLDPIADKLLVLSIAFSLLAAGKLAVLHVLLLGARELLQLPIAAALWLSRSVRDANRGMSASLLGKLTTLLQFSAAGLVLLDSPRALDFIHASAVLGVAAAASYATQLFWRLAR